MLPPAPARVSTKNCCPNAVVSWSAASRARTSAAPPGAKPLTIRTGRLGHSSAQLVAGTPAATNHEATSSML
jgi:hypothetical protein